MINSRALGNKAIVMVKSERGETYALPMSLKESKDYMRTNTCALTPSGTRMSVMGITGDLPVGAKARMLRDPEEARPFIEGTVTSFDGINGCLLLANRPEDSGKNHH